MNRGKNIPPNTQALAALDQHPAATNQNQSALRLWLVDDNKDLRSLLSNLLNRAGMIECTREFSSAEALLQTLRKVDPPEAILLDVQMAGMSGIDAIEPIRSLAPSTHIFVMTTFYDGDLAARAFNLGASGFLLKRHEAERIVECIRRVSAEPVPRSHLRVAASRTASKWRWLPLARWTRRDSAEAKKGQSVRGRDARPARPLFARAIGALRTFL